MLKQLTYIGSVSLLLLLLLVPSNQSLYAQCNNTTPFGTVTAPTSSIPVTITTCAFAGEYNTINGAVAGQTYLFTSSIGTDFLTVRQGTPGGAVLATGTGTVSATVTVSGPIYLHVNTNSSCGTQNTCRTTTVACSSCAGPPTCDFLVPFSGSNSITACGGIICDHGGQGSYANNANGFTIINPATPGALVRLTFLSFALECCCDFVRVYNGAGLGGALLFQGNCTTLPPVITSTTGPLTIQFTSDFSVVQAGFSAEISCLQVCSPTLPANIVTSNDPGQCGATVNFTVNPGSCSSVSVTPPSGSFFPVGTTTVSVTADGATQTFTVTVNDTEGPVFNCPSNQVVTLGPGACSAFVNYNVSATDNCGASGPAGAVFTTSAGATGNFFNSFAGITFDVRNDGPTPITLDGFRIPVTGGGPINVNVHYTTTATTNVGVQGNAGAWTLLGSATGIPVTTQATAAWNVNTFTQVNIGGLTLAPGQSKGIYVHLVNYPAGTLHYTNGNFTATDGTLTVLSNGYGGTQVPFANTFFPRAFVGEVQYSAGGGGTGELDVLQTSGLPSGSEFGIGTTQNCFEATDGVGITSTCCFTVTVNNFPNPTNTLSCNNNVQISLDETGCITIGADMILEGGPYSCYDNYTVQVLNQAGFNTGSQVCCSNVGQTLTVRVVAPNGNMCWGSVTVKDKLKPTIVCRDITISCTEAIPNVPAPEIDGFVEIIYSGLNDPIGTPGVTVQEYQFDLSFLPPGAPVLDVNARIFLDNHTWLPDLDILVIAPNGTVADIFTLTGCFGQEWPINVLFDDEGAGGLAQCVQLNAGGAPIQPVVAPGQSGVVLNQLDGLNASGIWTVRITDNVAGDDGIIRIVGLQVTVPDFPQIDPSDNCAIQSVTFTESVANGNCSGPSQTIIRTWTATDPSGNSASCVQTITRERPSLADVEVPPSYDDIEAPKLNCSGQGWDTNGNGYPDVAETGQPTINGLPFTNGGICGITTTFSDLIIPICEGSFKVRRQWILIDWCTGQEIVYNQLINVMDFTGPNVVCPTGPLTINVFSSSGPPAGPHQICTGNVVIPPVTVLGDNCSSLAPGLYVTELWTQGAGTLLKTINGNGGIFFNVELKADLPPSNNAIYTVRHRIYDTCGNVTDCLYDIIVVDKVPPVAICKEFTEISITNAGGSGQGCSVLPAHTLNNGSYDNCGPVYFYAAVMNPFLTPPFFYQYYPSLTFCCSDLGNQNVILLVLDFNPATVPGALQPDGSVFLFPGNPIYDGKFNTCMVNVEVTDKLPPLVLNCPPNQTITCENYLQNLAPGLALGNNSVLDQYGTAAFYDNCTFNLNYNVVVNINTCVQGTITRTWVASDSNGSATCVQTITVNHVNFWEIQFPADITAQCINGTLPNFGEPTVFFDECELIGISFEDQVFTVVPDACYKIIRTWTAINWCVYSPTGNNNIADPLVGLRRYRSGSDGFIRYQQVIKVVDNDAPVFTIPAIDGCIVSSGCTKTLNLPYPIITDACSPNFTVNITGSFGTFNNISAAGVNIPNVGPGTYNVNYSVTDNCGNTSFQTVTVLVQDCKKPTPYCVNGLVIEIMQTGMVDVWASDFNAGSFDNCGPVQLSFSPNVNNTSLIFTCNNLGQNVVQLWVTDAAGNQDYCETFVIVQDNMNACNTAAPIAVAGLIQTENIAPVAGVTVDVNGGLFTQVTANDGHFTFSLNAGGDYTITPMLDQNPLNGVTTFDLVLIQRHILGVQLLNSPYKIIAADANRSNSLTTIDMVQIRKLILQIDTHFTNNTSWRFIPASHVFVNPMNPFTTPLFPEVLNFNNLNANQLNASFVAIKIGDVNGSAQVNADGDSENRSFAGTLVLETANKTVKAGEEVRVSLSAADMAVLGYQFTLNFDAAALSLTNIIEGVASAENFGTTKLAEGAITTSWNVTEARMLNADEALFTLVFKANQTAELSRVLSVNSRYTAAEAYGANGELLNVQLSFNGQVAVAGFELYQNVPNPFKGVTTIGFNLPEASKATLKIMDVSGKMIRLIEGEYVQGYNEVRVSGLSGATGVLYYQLDTPTASATKKMIIIE